MALLEKLESEKKDSSVARKYYELALRTIEKLYETYPMNLGLQKMLASFVITSYSIHYTKLYELQYLLVRVMHRHIPDCHKPQHRP